jgi:hypothetical protein
LEQSGGSSDVEDGKEQGCKQMVVEQDGCGITRRKETMEIVGSGKKILKVIVT